MRTIMVKKKINATEYTCGDRQGPCEFMEKKEDSISQVCGEFGFLLNGWGRNPPRCTYCLEADSEK